MEKKELKSKIYTAIDSVASLKPENRKLLVTRLMQLIDSYTVHQVTKVVKAKLTK